MSLSVLQFQHMLLRKVSKLFPFVLFFGKKPGHTSSKELSITYLTVVTSRDWPIRCIRAKACSSTCGFQWGSMRYARLAEVRSIL